MILEEIEKIIITIFCFKIKNYDYLTFSAAR